MHIMFMAQCYAPEDVSAAVQVTESAEDYRNRHQVIMGPGAPDHPNGQVFHGYRNMYQFWMGGWTASE
jgi:hypothetical protein